jgi:hypothetical protein
MFSFFNLTAFVVLEQLPEALWDPLEALDFQKPADKMDNLEKASLLFCYKGQEAMDSQPQGAQVYPVL